jgi:hypothetical protein
MDLLDVFPPYVGKYSPTRGVSCFLVRVSKAILYCSSSSTGASLNSFDLLLVRHKFNTRPIQNQRNSVKRLKNQYHSTQRSIEVPGSQERSVLDPGTCTSDVPVSWQAKPCREIHGTSI